MKVMSSVGLGLCLVLGFLFLALLAEVYYLLWWKKRKAHMDIEGGGIKEQARELFCLFKKPASFNSTTVLNPQRPGGGNSDHDGQKPNPNLPSNSSKDFWLTALDGDDSIEAELMRIHSLQGPPRFLSTIKEESNEDMELDGSENGRRRRSSSSDVIVPPMDTPVMTPISSPPSFSPPLTPPSHYTRNGFNPLFDSCCREDAIGRKSSPPPKFKFMRDAEEKLYRRTLREEASKAAQKIGCSIDNAKNPCNGPPSVSVASPTSSFEERDGSLVTFGIGKNHHHMSPFQVVPLSSSPSCVRESHANLIATLDAKV